MKKLVALFLTAAMMLCALPAFATEINWADLEAQSAETVAKGEFVTFDEISIKMWMPTVLSAVELTDEDKEGAGRGKAGRFRSPYPRCACKGWGRYPQGRELSGRIPAF